VKSPALGLVDRRTGKFQVAIEHLNTRINLGKGKANGFDQFVLALS
jgi:hypothetical protein